MSNDAYCSQHRSCSQSCCSLPVLLLSGCDAAQQSNVPGMNGLPAETTEAAVFYSTGQTLVEEPRVVDVEQATSSR